MKFSHRQIGRVQFMQLTAGRDFLDRMPAGGTPRQRRRLLQQELKNRLITRAGLTALLKYTAAGKPFLTDGRHISITHFDRTAALAVAPFPIGLDGEMPDPRLLRVRNKFLHPDEHKHHHPDHLMFLTRIWTAKEAVYKLAGRPGLVFARDIHVRMATGSSSGQAHISGVGDADLYWFGKDAVFCLAYFVADKLDF